MPTATLFFIVPVTALAADSTIWIEAEQYASSNFAEHWQVSSMGKEHLLSGGQWIMRGVGEEEVAELIPDEGVLLTYPLSVEQPGEYRLWARVGWFHARADFEWRIGEGPWNSFSHEEPTTNLMELGFFCEVSWADLGPVRLQESTELEIRYLKTNDGKQRMLMALDCLAIVQGSFLPDGPFRPGETYDRPMDRQAAEQVFQLPAPRLGQRSSVKLNGLWQVARFDDPDMDHETYQPVQALPEKELRWMAFETPGNPWEVEPLVFGHRLIYRTRINVPEETAGRGFKLHFSGTNWIVSVFVNGRLAGTHKSVWVPWDLDITRHVRPGQVNELSVIVKGTYYAMDPESTGGKSIHAERNRPLGRKQWSRWVAPMYPSVKGDGDGYVYGIVNPVTLVCTGAAYTEDVFVKPSVENNALGLEYVIRNTTDRKINRPRILVEAIQDGSGEVEKSWTVPLAALEPNGATTVLAEALAWDNPKLWWPKPNPDLYRLRTMLRDDSGAVIDVQEQLFGFREVTLKGTGLYINGVRRNFWNWVDVSSEKIERPKDWVDSWRADGSRFMRFSHGRKISKLLTTREERLDFFDRHGVPGRLCTMIDGMFISYGLLDRSGSGEERVVQPNPVIWENFREHMAQVARAYRNHPSVILYQAENELVYINGMNLYGGDLDVIEEAMNEVIEAGREQDPTRPYTVGGGGDLSGRLEINAPHYPTATLDYYPENAYSVEHYSTKIQRWPWDRSKPWHIGECSFSKHLEYGTLVSGSRAARSKQQAREAKAKYLRMLYGGYRWAGVHAFFPWDNLAEFEDAQKVFSDLSVIPRKQTHRLYGGRDNELLVKVMNDTLSNAPLTFSWSYAVDGERVTGDEIEMRVEPGFGQEYALKIKPPPAASRASGVLQVKVSQQGAKGYVDSWSIPTLPSVDQWNIRETLLVYDRSGRIGSYMAGIKQPFETIDSWEDLKDASGLLLVGPDTLTADEAFAPGLLAFAVRGGRVVCLEQQLPPAGAALPAPLRPTARFGGYAHPTALGTPAFADLGGDDLIDWVGDHPTYQSVYEKPSQGARALAVAGSSLEYSPLIEVPCGTGVIILCQLRVGAKLGLDPAADILLRNLVDVYGEYRPASGVASFVGSRTSPLRDKLAQTGVLLEDVPTLEAALDADKYRVAVVAGTPQNLSQLVSLAKEVTRFQQAGGWVVLCNVDQQGMQAFNRLVGGDFLWRPFRMESVTLHHDEYRLAATLSDADVALLSPEKIMHSTYWVSQNTFSGVIDATDEFGRFTLPPEAADDPFMYEPTRNDHDPYNFVNGLMADDSWRYTRQLWVNDDETMGDLVFRLRKPDCLKTIRIWNLDTYGTINDLEILFDGDPATAVSMRLPHATQLATLELPEPVSVKETITLRPKSWTLKGRPNAEGNEIRLAGINNLSFSRPKEPAGVISLDTVGGLVAFPRGSGGFFLNQLKFLENDPKPSNEAQKIRVFGTLLANMGVGFRTAADVAVAGVNVRFEPLKLQEYGNAYLDAQRGDQAWFGSPKQADLAKLPRGEQTLADVPYHITNYATAPTPDVIILGGESRRFNPEHVRDLPDRVEGIRVGRTVDLFYFLHTAHVGGPITEREREQMNDRRRPFELPTVMKYVLHYADGQTAEIPVVLERQIDHWDREQPTALFEARIAWRQRLKTLEAREAVLYSMQAANPRPDVAIESIDIVRTSQRAVPAVLGITLGKVIQID
jgi:hypothetical protein